MASKVEEARKKYENALRMLDAIRGIEFDVAEESAAVEAAWDAIIASVRKEERARIVAAVSGRLSAIGAVQAIPEVQDAINAD